LRDILGIMNTINEATIIIEYPRGSYKSFELPAGSTYPLAGVTYPVDYGSIDGYVGEDEDSLDVFVGTGTLSGFIEVRREDVPFETKFVYKVTDKEWKEIIHAFAPVLKNKELFADEEELNTKIAQFKR
jgi:hypothetical protein